MSSHSRFIAFLFGAPLCCAPLAVAFQGPPVTSVSRTVGLAINEMDPNSAAGLALPTGTLFAPAGSSWLLAIEALPPGVANVATVLAPILGPVAVNGSPAITIFPANNTVGPNYIVNATTGFVPGTVPLTATSESFDWAAPIPPAIGGLQLKFQALVAIPSTPTVPAPPPLATNAVIRSVLLAAPPVAPPITNGYVDAPAPIGFSFPTPLDIEQGDVDGDGDEDVLIVRFNSTPVLLLNNAAGGYPINNEPSFVTGADTTAELADFDNDGFLDFAVGRLSGASGIPAVVYPNGAAAIPVPTSGVFLPPVALTTTPPNATANVNDLETADVDLDGLIDIALGCGLNPLTGEQNRLFLNVSCNALTTACTPGTIAFVDATVPNMPLIADDTEDIEFSDLDLDGDFDLVIGNFDGPAPITGVDIVLVNQGGSQGGILGQYVSPVVNPIPPLNDETLDVCVGDVNNDGLPDIYVGNWLTSTQTGGTTTFGPPQFDRLLLNVTPVPGGQPAFADVSFVLPDNLLYTGPTPAAPWFSTDVDMIDSDADGDLDIDVALGSAGISAAAPFVGLNRGINQLINTGVGAGGIPNPFVLVGAINGLPRAGTGDYTDIERGDWQTVPQFLPTFVRDVGATTLNAGVFWIGKTFP